MPCFFGVASCLFSVLVEDSGLASTILFPVIGFLGKLSLALSTDIVFPYTHLQPQDASDKVREPPRTGGPLFPPSIGANRPAPIWLCKQIGNLEQLLNDARAVRIALGSTVRFGSTTGSSPQHVRPCPLWPESGVIKSNGRRVNSSMVAFALIDVP